MGPDPHTRTWQVVGKSVRGAVHERNGLSNQDAICWLLSSGEGSSMVLALADGHGSARYSRSHHGASIAVETASQLVSEFLENQTSLETLSLIKDSVHEWLPRALVRKWMEVVSEHPLLIDYVEAHTSIYLAGASPDASAILGDIEDALNAATSGWRP